MILTFTALLGLVVGSFLNVAIYRLPRRESVISPGSKCTSCGVRLGPLELVPVASFLWQRGRCTHCGERISGRYLVVELLTALAFATAYHYFGLVAALPYAWIFLALLITISFTDLEHRIIPNAAVAASFILGGIVLLLLAPVSPVDAGLGVLFLGGFTLLVHLIRSDGLGMGDVKLAAAMGLFLGWRAGLLALFLGMVLGAVGGIALVVVRRKTWHDYIPFGPFLAAGSVLALFWGPQFLTFMGV